MYSGYKRYRSYSGKRYGTRYSRYGSSALKANRTIRSAQQGTKRVTINIPRTFDASIPFTSGSATSGVLTVSATKYSADQSTLPYCPSYIAYANLYDQCRIIGCKLSWSFGDGLITSGSSYMTFYSCLDRMNGNSDGSNPETMTAAEIASSSSCVKTNFTVQQRLSTRRAFYASTFLEKNTWWDSTPIAAGAGHGAYIPSLIQSQTTYNPCLHFFVQAAGAPTADVSLPFRVEINWILEFRNPKLSIASSAKGIEVTTRATFCQDSAIPPAIPMTDEKEKKEEQPAMAAAEGGTS